MTSSYWTALYVGFLCSLLGFVCFQTGHVQEALAVFSTALIAFLWATWKAVQWIRSIW